MKNFNSVQAKKWDNWKKIAYLAYYLGIISTALYFDIALFPTFLIVVFSSFIFLIDLADNKQIKYKQGEEGELEVDKRLETIPNITFFRDIAVGEDAKWNIDFVVIAGNGVFVLEVKSYEGRISANKDFWYQFRNNRRNTLSSFSKQAKSNSFNLINYMKEKYPEKHFSFFNAVVVLTKPFDKMDIKIDDAKYLVSSVEELHELFDFSRKPNIEIVKVFENEFGRTEG